MIKKLENNLWEIKEKDFEAILDDKWLLMYLNGNIQIWNTEKE